MQFSGEKFKILHLCRENQMYNIDRFWSAVVLVRKNWESWDGSQIKQETAMWCSCQNSQCKFVLHQQKYDVKIMRSDNSILGHTRNSMSITIFKKDTEELKIVRRRPMKVVRVLKNSYSLKDLAQRREGWKETTVAIFQFVKCYILYIPARKFSSSTQPLIG